MQIPWYIAAFGAALVWGLHYPLIGHLLKSLSLPSVLYLTTIPSLLLLPFFYTHVKTDLAGWSQLSMGTRQAMVMLTITSLTATLLLFLSIQSKNATLASLIEISYPLFVALFAFLLFKDVQINLSTVIGGALVFAGIGIIIFFNRAGA